MIIAKVGRIDQHFTDAEVADFLGADLNEAIEWHELVPDPSAEEDFERIYQRDLLRRLLERAKLSQREREALTIFLNGESLTAAAKKRGFHRQNYCQAFRSAIAKLRRTVIELGEALG